MASRLLVFSGTSREAYVAARLAIWRSFRVRACGEFHRTIDLMNQLTCKRVERCDRQPRRQDRTRRDDRGRRPKSGRCPSYREGSRQAAPAARAPQIAGALGAALLAFDDYRAALGSSAVPEDDPDLESRIGIPGNCAPACKGDPAAAIAGAHHCASIKRGLPPPMAAGRAISHGTRHSRRASRGLSDPRMLACRRATHERTI